MPNTPLRLDAILAKEESTYGTDAAPVAATDGVRVTERVWSTFTPSFVFPNAREDVGNGLIAGVPAAPKGRIGVIDIAWEARGSGTAGTAPEAGPLFVACGMSETIVAVTSVTYAPIDTGHGSATVWAYAGGKLFKLVGCRGTWTWEVRAGLLGIVRFNMQGIITAEVTEVAMPAVTYQAQIPEAAVGLGLAVGGWSPDVIQSDTALGNTVSRLDDGNAADGVGLFAITKTEPTFVLNAREVALATYDPYAIWKARTVQDADQTLGATAGNLMALDVNAGGYITNVAPIDDNEHAAWSITYDIRNAFSVIFT